MTRTSSLRRFRASFRGVIAALVVGVFVGAGLPAIADTGVDAPTAPEGEGQVVVGDEATPGEPEAVPETSEPQDPAPEPESPVVGDETEGDAETEADAEVEAAEAGLIEPDVALEITPFAFGPDGAAPPYVYWETRTAANALVGGATYELQGPRTGTFSENWNTMVTIADCIAAPCAGPDLDPDPGEYLVKSIGPHQIGATNRYRVRQQNAPSGHYFTASGNAWVTIAGSGNTPSGWQNQTYDFGTFRVAPMSDRIRCEAGYIYQISGNGWLRQVAPNGAITNLAKASGSSVNGLGIGHGGSPVYAYERTNSSQTANMRQYNPDNPATNAWTSLADSYNSGVGLVGGAVDFASGKYMFGGFSSDGGQFRIFRYNPGETPRFTSVGYINTNSGGNPSSNGDMAFDAQGNLFVVRGVGTSTTVFSVSAANLAAASGGLIASSQSTSFTTMMSVNGVAFDAGGRGFLGAGAEMRRYNMPNWSGMAVVTSSMSSSTDLASCSSPPTITVEKYVQGTRVRATDQFQLTLDQGAQQLGMTTTTGNQPGRQADVIGPLPTARGVSLTFGETAAGTTSLGDYASSWRCLIDGTPLASGEGTSGNVTIPASGDVIECRITNAYPLVANVLVSKTVRNALGDDPQPGVGWTVGAAAVATAGSVTSTAVSPAPVTDAQGSAAWSLDFAGTSSRATVTVSETQQAGYEFVRGECVITALSGTTRTVTLPSEAGVPVTGVAPGDTVECEYVNKVRPSTLTLVKQVGFGSADPEEWTLTAAGPDGSLPGPSGQTGVTAAVSVGVAYALSEDDPLPTYVQSGDWTCTAVDENDDTVAVTVTGGSVTIPRPGVDATCTVVNATASLVLLKQVPGGATFVASDFTLTAMPAAGAAELPTEAAVGAAAASAANTFEVRPGHTYTLTEASESTSLAYRNTALQVLVGTDPANDAHWETVTSTEVTVPAGEQRVYRFINDPVPAVVLPLTGGLSTDAFLILGTAVLGLALIFGAWHIRRSRRTRAHA